jgi:two-component system CheB/CheR fusion protein
MAMAQSPESARHDSILRSAIATGLVDHVLPPEDMPEKLLEYAAYLKTAPTSQSGATEETAQQLGRICDIVRRRTGHDFSQYKGPTLIRRIQRRMQVLQVPSVVGYLSRLRNDPKESDQLFRDLLIGVTHFFRDPQAFAALAREVIPKVVARAGPEGPIRVWTPGCATGEEAYSVAILLKEEMARRDYRCAVQVFAGDIDEEALEFARVGRYPEGIAEHVPPERLERFFSRLQHSYQVEKEIREMCLFSTHNLIKDPPFSRLDLILCRNLLIYLESDIQKHVTTLFHYSLRPDGYLFLGPAEGVSGPADLFSVIDKKHKIYKRNETVARPPLVLGPAGRRPRPSDKPWTARVATSAQGEMVAGLERLLLDHYAPAWIIVNAQGEGMYFSPRTGRYLQPAAGLASMDVVNMARKGLRLDLRTAVHTVVRTGEEVVREGVEVATDGSVQRINLIVRPITEAGTDPGLFLVVFQETGPPRSLKDAAPGSPDGSGESLVQQLESELRMTKEHLQATVEEVETSNEELKSSNEELLSTNEELQSANEELQTSKEELQSVNEELETINAELSKKIEELDLANGDLQNLFQSTQIPTVFLDAQMRVKRFTAAATDVFRLIESDVGRPISDISSPFEGDLMADLKEVFRTLVPRERQMKLRDGSQTFLLRVLPYRRVDNAVEGLVVTYMDVTELNRALEVQARLGAIVESSQDAIVGWTLEGTITTWNAAATRMFGYTAEEASGQHVSLILSEGQQEELDEVAVRMRKGEPLAPFESVRRAKDGRQLDVSVAISPVRNPAARPMAASAIFRDIGDLKRAQQALENETRRKDEFLALLGHELRNPLAPLRNSVDILRTQGADEERKRTSLEVMERQLAHMTALVDQLLDASRISSGKIMLHSEEVVRLPLASVAPRATGPPARRPMGEARTYGILLVEDNTDSAESLRALLEIAGYTVEVANDGPAALAAARTFHPEVVLCDIGLPGSMDGYAVAAALRKASDGRQPYLIALTGYGQPADRHRALEAGFDRHITKPADPTVLRRILEDVGRGD